VEGKREECICVWGLCVLERERERKRQSNKDRKSRAS
jgi:pyrimidine nucleoside transport protein